MLRPRAPFLTSLLAAILLAPASQLAKSAFKAVFDVTVQDFWKDTVAPFLQAHVGPWSTTMLEWVGPYWSGIGSAFALMFVVEMIFAWRRLAESRRNAVAAQTEVERLNELVGSLRAELSLDLTPEVEGAGLRERVQLAKVAGRVYINERVVLDGSHYTNCTFQNVIFVYNGGAMEISHSKINGFQLATDSRKMNRMLAFMNDFGLFSVPASGPYGPLAPANPIPKQPTMGQ